VIQSHSFSAIRSGNRGFACAHLIFISRLGIPPGHGPSRPLTVVAALRACYGLSVAEYLTSASSAFQSAADDAEKADQHGFTQKRAFLVLKNPQKSALSALSAANPPTTGLQFKL